MNATESEGAAVRPRFALTPGVTVAAALAAGLFLYVAWCPLFHADLWGHLAYGRWIAAHGRLPATEPLMPLAAGVPATHFAWLTQLAGWGVWRAAGVGGLRVAGAGLVTAAAWLLGTAVYRRTASAGGAVAGVAVFLAVAWMQLFARPEQLAPQMLRPQTAGLVCFTLLLRGITRYSVVAASRRHVGYGRRGGGTPPPRTRRPGARRTRGDLHRQACGITAVALLFAAWANLHGSWTVGLALLLGHAAGEAGDLLRRGVGPAALARSRRVRRANARLIAAAAGVCLNPVGPSLYVAAAELGTAPAVHDLIEWRPISPSMVQGRAALAAAVLLAGLFAANRRFLPARRVRTAELLWLCGFGVMTLAAGRFVLWWAVAAGYAAGVHAAPRLARLPVPVSPEPRRRWAAAASVAWLIALAATPLARHGVRGLSPSAVSADTPLAALAHLRGHPPTGLVFHPQPWGDLLTFAGPPGTRVFTNSHAHLVPPAVWRDASRISAGADGWDALLDRYGVGAVLVDRWRQPALLRGLEAHASWRRTHRDGRAAVYRRLGPSRSGGVPPPHRTGRSAAEIESAGVNAGDVAARRRRHGDHATAESVSSTANVSRSARLNPRTRGTDLGHRPSVNASPTTGCT